MRFDLKGIKAIAIQLYEKISDDDILGNAAQVGFYFSFAIFPLLLFLTTLFGLILSNKEDLQNQLYLMLSQVMPPAAYELVTKTLNEVTSNATTGKLTIGILITLWSASAGIDNTRGTLNEVYNLKETRSWFRAKLTSVLLTIGLGVLILITLALIVYGSQFLDSILPIDSFYVLEAMQWIAVLALLFFAFALIYNFAPNHDPFRWKWITPGAVIGVVLWLLFSGAFRLYLRYFDSYAATYGSLGAMIILMLWLYLTALVILVGGAINAIFDERSGIKKEAEDPRQTKDEKAERGKAAKT
ncbi:MAG TPA: YihY/virulence factor BrkB family protein [Pyrinomonadaceae bacterium]|nr:YihY/virulence factor BrkB family protein [Pyrinomonadaceae bacterium]